MIKPFGPVPSAALLVLTPVSGSSLMFGKKSQVDSYLGQQLCPFCDGGVRAELFFPNKDPRTAKQVIRTIRRPGLSAGSRAGFKAH